MCELLFWVREWSRVTTSVTVLSPTHTLPWVDALKPASAAGGVPWENKRRLNQSQNQFTSNITSQTHAYLASGGLRFPFAAKYSISFSLRNSETQK